MDTWWNGLDLELQIVYALALAGTLLLGLQLVLLFLGADADLDAEADLGDLGHGDGAGQVFSIRSIAAFLTGFGWTGVAALEAGWSIGAASLAALVVGALFVAGSLALIRGLMSLRASGSLDYRNAVGQVGTVYLAVPAAMAGPGRIEVLVQGRMAEVAAFTRADRRLAARERVQVVGVLDPTTVLVAPLADPAAPDDPVASAGPTPQEPRP